ncbi:hemolysin [Stenotrophomonas maltophilia]
MRSIENAALSNAIYDTSDSRDPRGVEWKIVGGTRYEVIARLSSKNGYQGAIYRNETTNEVIVAHRGTEQPFVDGAVDAMMVTTRLNAQLDDALALTCEALRIAEERSIGPVYVTGHSLGGTLAQISAHHYNLPGDAFNPYGAASLGHRVPEGLPANAAPFTNHVMAGDVVSAASPHYGKVEMYALPAELQTLRHAEQRRGAAHWIAPGLSLRHLHAGAVAVELMDSHSMDHFIDRITPHGPVESVLEDPRLRIIHPEDQRRVDDYRQSVQHIRAGATLLMGGVPGLARDGINHLRGTDTPGIHTHREADAVQRSAEALKPGHRFSPETDHSAGPLQSDPKMHKRSPTQERVQSLLDAFERNDEQSALQMIRQLAQHPAAQAMQAQASEEAERLERQAALHVQQAQQQENEIQAQVQRGMRM